MLNFLLKLRIQLFRHSGLMNFYKPVNRLETGFKAKEEDQSHCLVMAFSLQRLIWSFHVADLQRTEKKCTKVQNALEDHCFPHEMLLFLGQKSIVFAHLH